jgi:hypothetical protein
MLAQCRLHNRTNIAQQISTAEEHATKWKTKMPSFEINTMKIYIKQAWQDLEENTDIFANTYTKRMLEIWLRQDMVNATSSFRTFSDLTVFVPKFCIPHMYKPYHHTQNLLKYYIE